MTNEDVWLLGVAREGVMTTESGEESVMVKVGEVLGEEVVNE